ncbi:MAG: hypothetical protein ABI114_05115 [Rhodanobacter sp.]
MAENPPQGIPTEVTAGDTISWRRIGGDYPASAGWVLAYTLLSAAAVFNATATPDGDDFLIDVPAATSAAWAAGSYRVQEYVTSSDGTQRFTLATYALQVLPNAAAATAGMDTRTHAQIVLDSINAYLETKAPVYASMEINGRKLGYYTLADLLKLRDRYAMMVLTEQRIASGKTGGNRILAVL